MSKTKRARKLIGRIVDWEFYGWRYRIEDVVWVGPGMNADGETYRNVFQSRGQECLAFRVTFVNEDGTEAARAGIEPYVKVPARLKNMKFIA